MVRTRVHLFALLVIIATILASQNAEGSKGWCRSDPVVIITSPSGVTRSFAIMGAAEIQLQTATYVIRTPPGYVVDVAYEFGGLAVYEDTSLAIGTEGSNFKFSLLTTPKSGTTSAIELRAVERFGDTKTTTGFAGTQIWTTFSS